MSPVAYADLGVSTTALASGLQGYADLETSREALAFHHKRQLLLQALDWIAADAEKTVSRVSLARALAFIHNMPLNRALPRVAVDEDGDVLMVWDVVPTKRALTFEGMTLHMVINPGANSTHIDPTIYHGGHIPPQLLQHIPDRG